MAAYSHKGKFPSLEELKRLGDKHMAEAQQACAIARRLAEDTAGLLAQTRDRHTRFSGTGVALDVANGLESRPA